MTDEKETKRREKQFLFRVLVLKKKDHRVSFCRRDEEKRENTRAKKKNSITQQLHHHNY